MGQVTPTVLDLRLGLLSWWQFHGRHDIPWKFGGPPNGNALTDYSIWVAEVMLNSTA